MGTPEEDRKALEAAGLEAPKDVSGLSEAEKLDLIEERKRQAAKEELVLPHGLTIHKAHNADPTNLSKEALLERMAVEEEEAAAAKEAYHRRLVRDKAHREERWDAKVPHAFRSAKIDALPSELRTPIRRWFALDERTNIIFLGPTGTGKSFCAYAIARELYIERSKVMVQDAQALPDKLKPGNPDKDKVFEQVKTVNYLVLDDLGWERQTDFQQERFHLIFDHRWQWGLPLIITANIMLDKFPDQFGDRITSRLLHNAEIIMVTGDDRRI
jgi:DNA replication protein DnaC